MDLLYVVRQVVMPHDEARGDRSTLHPCVAWGWEDSLDVPGARQRVRSAPSFGGRERRRPSPSGWRGAAGWAVTSSGGSPRPRTSGSTATRGSSISANVRRRRRVFAERERAEPAGVADLRGNGAEAIDRFDPQPVADLGMAHAPGPTGDGASGEPVTLEQLRVALQRRDREWRQRDGPAMAPERSRSSSIRPPRRPSREACA